MGEWGEQRSVVTTMRQPPPLLDCRSQDGGDGVTASREQSGCRLRSLLGSLGWRLAGGGDAALWSVAMAN
jgi:hypothetical protein